MPSLWFSTLKPALCQRAAQVALCLLAKREVNVIALHLLTSQCCAPEWDQTTYSSLLSFVSYAATEGASENRCKSGRFRPADLIAASFKQRLSFSFAECPSHRWGPNCELECTCNHNGTCDRFNGWCHCPPGYYGISCGSGKLFVGPQMPFNCNVLRKLNFCFKLRVPVLFLRRLRDTQLSLLAIYNILVG